MLHQIRYFNDISKIIVRRKFYIYYILFRKTTIAIFIHHIEQELNLADKMSPFKKTAF